MSHVTVILSTFNGDAYLEEAILSVLGQTHRDLKFLVRDDGSSDNTVSILKRLSDQDSRLIVLENEVNRGTGYCYSDLIAQATGEYIACIGQDDIWDNLYLETSLKAIEGRQEINASFAKFRIIDSRGVIQPSAESPFRLEFAAQLSPEDLSCELLKKNFFCAVSAVFKRKDIQGWRTLGDNDQLQDWETWLHLNFKGKFLFLPDCLVSYRIHGNNLSLGGHSPTQAQTELVHTRATTLSSEDFARYVLSQPDPNQYLQNALAAISETINPDETSHYFLLLFALKKNEHLLRHLSSYQSVMAILHLHTGSYFKAKRYTYLSDVIKTCPKLFLAGFEWRTLVSIGTSNSPISNSQFIRERRICNIRIFTVFAKKNVLPLVGPIYIYNAKTVDHLIEQHFAFRDMGWMKKIRVIAKALGLRKFVLRMRSIKKKITLS